jgi:antitoxin ParD1/3/4
MNPQIPSDWGAFVQRMLAERRFLSESDVLAEGLRLLQAREMLRQEVRWGFDQLDVGRGIDAATVYERALRAIHDVEVPQSDTQ